MDRQAQDDTEALASLIDRFISRIETAIPGIIKEFDATRQILIVEPAIRKYVTIDDEQTALNIPPIIEVPLTIPYAQTLGFALTLPFSPGDEVLLEVCHKSIDNWVQFGGKQNPAEPVVSRHHQITDSIAITGLISVPKALTDYQTDAIEMRNADRSVRVTLKNDLVEAVAGASSIVVDGSAGTITIVAPNGIFLNGLQWSTHSHAQGDDSGGDTEQPTGPPQ